MLLPKNIKFKKKSLYVKFLSRMGYGYMSPENWLLRFGEDVLCIFRLEIVFVDGGTEHGNYYQIAWHDVTGKFNL
jgi:hypothetical protein